MQKSENPSRNRSLNDPIQYIKGVGPKKALLFKKLNLNTVEDCLYFLPFRYEDRTRVKKIAELSPGEQVTFTGEIIQSGSIPIGRRKKIYELLVQDETGTIPAKWFQFNERYMQERFQVGTRWILSGKPAISRYGGARLEIYHPDMEAVTGDGADSLEMGRMVPIYHTTEGLYLKSLRTIMKNILDGYAPLVEEFLSDQVLRRHKFPPRDQALQMAHFPPPDQPQKLLDRFKTPAQQRLIFEELFLIQLGLAFRRKHAGETARGRAFQARGELIHRFVKLLKFELTGAQKKVLREIMEDLETDRPMNRLLQGDVGSGKTIVALIALLTAVDNGTQAAFMAPTEILSEQHFLNIQPFCEQLGVTCELVTSAAKPKEKKIIQKNILEGKTQIVIGTHAIIQKDVQFKDLGLAVIDEQHRFGVLQREALGKKGIHPHVLVMTATPIPRSLALTLYGDMDVSLLDEFPPGRKPIATRLFFENKRDQAYAFLRQEVSQGRQAYVVCPLIEESETLDMKTVIEVHDYLQHQLFPDFTVRLVHGRIRKEERQQIMSDFKAERVHILVATTVIEVGLDIPNATLMIIEHAERFGLSQIHQLRGRVGRGSHSSHCLLIAYHPLSADARARLEAVQKSTDGFEIAEEDLKIRGPGDFMGTRQSGMPTLKVANLLRDLKILESARKEAFLLIDQDAKLEKPQNQKLKRALNHYLGNRLELLNII